jgi:toxin ParE1/3/4
MAEYRLTPAAERDVEAIWKYTAQQWGVMQADRCIDFLTAAFDVLSQSPKTAPACDHIRSGFRRQSVERHMIYFRTTPYGIVPVPALHDSMDTQRHL